MEGKTSKLKNYIVHDDQKDIAFFTDKHNRISNMAANKLLRKKKLESGEETFKKNLEGKYRIWIKENILSNLPLFVRPFIVFFYKYFLKLGLLDGKEGLVYYLLHDFWYPFLVDAKLLEMLKKKKNL